MQQPRSRHARAVTNPPRRVPTGPRGTAGVYNGVTPSVSPWPKRRGTADSRRRAVVDIIVNARRGAELTAADVADISIRLRTRGAPNATSDRRPEVGSKGAKDPPE